VWAIDLIWFTNAKFWPAGQLPARLTAPNIDAVAHTRVPPKHLVSRS
jgi:hypothetical protein